MNKETKKCELTSCLTELGFTKAEIDCYLEYQKNNNKMELKRLLNQKRKIILDTVHTYYEKLECIDYLICMIDK